MAHRIHAKRPLAKGPEPSAKVRLGAPRFPVQAKPAQAKTANASTNRTESALLRRRFSGVQLDRVIQPKMTNQNAPFSPRENARAPIQLTKWRFDGNQWKSFSSSTADQDTFPPPHQRTFSPAPKAGDEYDQETGQLTPYTYSQSGDPTVKPFLTGGKTMMGQSGLQSQLSGSKPSADQIRVPALKTSDLRGGSGLHEIVPTNMRGEILGNKTLIGLQSGARTSTARTLFSRDTNEVGAHSGFSVKSSGRGSTHTKGQGPAHDKLRETVRKLKKETDPPTAVNTMLLSHIESQATGQDILNSQYATGMLPNQSSIGLLEPVSSTPGQQRSSLAEFQDQGRERVKTRIRSLKRATGKGRSPSPPRKLKGGYVSDDPEDYPRSPVPNFEGSAPWEQTANMSSWLTAPQREGFVHTQPTPSSPTPSAIQSPTSSDTEDESSEPPKKKRKFDDS